MRYPTVYQDAQVRVLENPAALPRAWLVHAARQVPAPTSLHLLAAGQVDPRSTALLEAAPPPLGRPADPAADRATITGYAADRIRLTTRSAAPALLVLSEVYYPAWKAYVDGHPVSLYQADYLLRAVPLPAGVHTVELRYEDPALRLGLAISLGTALTLAAALALATWRPWRGPPPWDTVGGEAERDRGQPDEALIPRRGPP